MNGINNIDNDTFNPETNSGSLDSSSSINVGTSTKTTKNEAVNTEVHDVKGVEEYDLSASETPDGCFAYIAEAGDTFASIAKVNGVSLTELKELNPDISGEITKGDIVYIPMKDIQMTPQEVGGGGSGDSSLNDDVANVPKVGGGSSGVGGGGSSSVGDESDQTEDVGITSADNYVPYVSDGSEGTIGQNDASTYAHTTTDLRNLSLAELEEISSNYSNSLSALLDKFNFTRKKFNKFMMDAYNWFMGQKLDVGSYSLADIMFMYQQENPSDNMLSKDDIEDILTYINILDEIQEEIDNREPEESTCNGIVTLLLNKLGYDGEQISEMNLFDKLNAIKDNSESLNAYLVEEGLVPDGYGIDSILLTYVYNNYSVLVPDNEDYDADKVLAKYLDAVGDLLEQVGISKEELSKMNVFELSNLMNTKMDELNNLFSKYGIEFGDSFGVAQLLESPMMSVAYSMIRDSEEMFIQYMDANDYSDDIKNEALEYYEQGNISSAILMLQLDDLNSEEIANNQRIQEIEYILYDGPIASDLDEYGKTFYENVCSALYLGVFDFDAFADGYTDFMARYNELKNKESLDELEQYELEDYETNPIYKVLFDEKCSYVISLHKEALELNKRQKEMNQNRYDLKEAIKENSFEYLDALSDTSEYQEAIKSRDKTISYNPNLIMLWDSVMRNSTTNLQSILSGNFLYMLNTSSMSALVEDVLGDAVNRINNGEYEDEVVEKILQYTCDLYCYDSIKDAEITENNEIKISFGLVYGYGELDVVYNYETGEASYVLKNNEGDIIKETDNLKDFDNVNYFEAFEELIENSGQSYLSRKDAIHELFYQYKEEIQPDSDFWVALMCFGHFTDEQINHYYYLYEVEGAERANEYLHTMRNSMHQIVGMEAAMEDLEFIMSGAKSIRTFFVGVDNGITGWEDNIRTLLYGDVVTTLTEYEQQYLLSILQSFASPIEPEKVKNGLSSEAYEQLCSLDNPSFLDYYHLAGQITDEQYNNLMNNKDFINLMEYSKNHPKVINYSYMIGQNIGNLLPSMIAAAALSPLGGVSIGGHLIHFGKAAASIAMFSGCYGGAYREAIHAGETGGKVQTYAFLKAASEVAMEYFLGRMPGVSRLSKSLNPVIGQTFWQKLAMTGINLAKDIGSEILEESLQIWIDYALDSAYLGKEIDLSKWPQEQIDTLIVTFITTLMLNGPSAVMTLQNDFNIKIDQKTGIKLSLAEIIKLNNEFVNEKTGEIDIVGLSSYIQDKISKANPKITAEEFMKKIGLGELAEKISKLDQKSPTYNQDSVQLLETYSTQLASVLSGEDFSFIVSTFAIFSSDNPTVLYKLLQTNNPEFIKAQLVIEKLKGVTASDIKSKVVNKNGKNPIHSILYNYLQGVADPDALQLQSLISFYKDLGPVSGILFGTADFKSTLSRESIIKELFTNENIPDEVITEVYKKVLLNDPVASTYSFEELIMEDASLLQRIEGLYKECDSEFFDAIVSLSAVEEVVNLLDDIAKLNKDDKSGLRLFFKKINDRLESDSPLKTLLEQQSFYKKYSINYDEVYDENLLKFLNEETDIDENVIESIGSYQGFIDNFDELLELYIYSNNNTYKDKLIIPLAVALIEQLKTKYGLDFEIAFSSESLSTQTFGYYSLESNTLFVNPYMLFSFKDNNTALIHAVDTVFHETRHARQFTILENSDSLDYTQLLWALDYYNYESDSIFGSYYQTNYEHISFEMDARAQAFVDTMSFFDDHPMLQSLVTNYYNSDYSLSNYMRKETFAGYDTYKGVVSIFVSNVNMVLDMAKQSNDQVLIKRYVDQIKQYPVIMQFFNYDEANMVISPKSREELKQMRSAIEAKPDSETKEIELYSIDAFLYALDVSDYLDSNQNSLQETAEGYSDSVIKEVQNGLGTKAPTFGSTEE